MSERGPTGRWVRAALVGATLAVAAGVLPATPAAAAPVRYPWSVLESIRVEGNRLVARGYSFDPDTTAPLDILMAVDAVDTKLSLHSAREYRPDVGAFWGRPFSGFTARSVPLAPGPHLMCIAARNVGAGEEWRLFGCKYFLVGPTSPIGTIDVARSLGDAVSVSGWAIDLETTAPIAVKVRVDGVTRVQVSADRRRNDLLGPYPLNGPHHGFAATVPIGPGTHVVCVVAVNRGAGADRQLGCRFVTGFPVDPSGSFEALTISGGTVRARGWAHDPDAPGPSNVRIGTKVSPLRDANLTLATASAVRNDIGAALGIDPRRGFDVELPLEEGGTATVCVSVDNRNRGSDRFLGCRTLAVADRRPAGLLTDVSPVADGLRIEGTVTDPDGGPVTVDVAVDGAVRRTVTAGPTFGVTVGGLGAGSHAVCVTARDVVGALNGLRGDTELPCGSAVLGAAPIATTGVPSVVGRVGPPAGHPIERVDRDAGLSVALHDGSTLWLFGDSSEPSPTGGFRYFVSGTAAWTSSAAPRTTRDAVTTTGAPFVFATPTGAWGSPCPATAPTRVLWPISAVGVPEPGGPAPTRTRVVVYLENVCLGSDGGAGSRGLSVAEWVYDPAAAPPADQPVRATVLANRIRDDRTYGMSSTVGPDGRIYAFSCTAPLGGGWPTEYGPCHASRVEPAQVHQRGSYRYWNGGPPAADASWVDDVAAAAPLDLPDQVFPSGAAVPVNPVASFTTRYDANFGSWVMVYSPWPGFTNEVVIRLADSPIGPWTAPLSVRLPGCDDSVGGVGRHCYAGTAQPQFSTADRIGFGYYDHLVAVEPSRGEYRVGSVRVVRGP